MQTNQTWPIPEFFAPDRVGDVWRVPYQERAQEAINWAQMQNIKPAEQDTRRICLVAIDVQNTFCIPGFELFVSGTSGVGAVEDTRRLCDFIYRNLGQITTIVPTLDTHQAMQIFHPIFWVNSLGEHPVPTATLISLAQVEAGEWQVNPAITSFLGQTVEQLHQHALHYTRQLTQAGKFPLIIWPYHSMLGGIGHALVSAFEEACFFHGMARSTQPQFELKGNDPLTENYSVLRPEVMSGADGSIIAHKNLRLIEQLLDYDAIIIAGQAKSHCVAWTIADLLDEINGRDSRLAQKIYLLDDCTSPVVVPGIVDFSEAAEEAYKGFAAAGMRRVSSIEAMSDWLSPDAVT